MTATPDSFPGPRTLARLSGRVGLAAFAGLLVIGLVTRLGHDPARMAAGALIGLVAAVPLFLVRPRVALGYSGVATAGVVLLGNADSHDIVWFALVVLAAWCVLSGGNRVGLVYWAATVLLFGGQWLWALRDPGWAPWIGGVTLSVLATMLIRHEFVLIEQLHAAQADLTERTRADERRRIGRELHDVIAHSLTVSLLHVTSARLAVEHDPSDAVRALAEAERLGRECLTEVRATMGLLRPASPTGIMPPVPGLDQLPDLVGQLRDAGVDIRLAIDPGVQMVPATTGSTLYRIAQESLTNATRHAPRAPVNVHVFTAAHQVELSVDSAGPPRRGSGLGLEGMQERARAVGGTCTAGPGGRGWLVTARLPLEIDRDERSP